MQGKCTSRFWIAALLFCSGAASAETISVRADDWFPVNGKPRSQQEGVYIDLMKAILEPAGHTVDYQLLTWDDAVESVRKGSVDCVVGAAKADAPDLVFARRAWMNFDNVYYAKVDAGLQVTRIEDLQSHTLGVIEGYSYGEAVDAYIEANKADPGRIQVVSMGRNPLSVQINRLVTGKVDLVIESSVVMQAQLQKLRLSDRLVPVGATGEVQAIYVACSPAKPGIPAILSTLDAGFDRLEQEGKLNAYYSKYGLDSQALLQAAPP